MQLETSAIIKKDGPRTFAQETLVKKLRITKKLVNKGQAENQ